MTDPTNFIPVAREMRRPDADPNPEATAALAAERRASEFATHGDRRSHARTAIRCRSVRACSGCAPPILLLAPRGASSTVART